MSKHEVGGYLTKRFPGKRPQQLSWLSARIHERTEGNPLFMVNVVDYLVDAGAIANSHAATAEESADTLDADRFDTPRTIRRMIERNLERLHPDEQAVLEGASVVGAEFSAASVAAALERPQTEIEACCMRLSRHEQFVTTQGSITWPDGTVAASFRFRHALYQEVLYGRLPPSHQVRLHRRIAIREEAGYAPRADEIAAELAHHYHLAKDKSKAIEYCRLAGDTAVARCAVVEAEGHYRLALSLLGELPQDKERDHRELALQMALGTVLCGSKSWAHPDARHAYKRAQELAEKLGKNRQLVGVLLGLVSSTLGSGQFKLGQELGERMLEAAKRSEDRAALCAAHTFLGQALVCRGHYVDAQLHLELGTGLYKDTVARGLGLSGIDAPALAANAVLLRGFPDRGRALMNEALRRSQLRNDQFRAGLVHMWGGFFYALLRDVRETIDHAQRLRRLADKQPVWRALADLYMGEALMIRGEWEEAETYLGAAITLFESLGLGGWLPVARLDEAGLRAGQGRIDEALALVDETLAATEEFGHLRVPALLRRANLLADMNSNLSETADAYRVASESAQNQQAKYYELLATTSFARWFKSQGRATEVRAMLADIYNWFTEGSETLALKEAGTLLHELARE